MCRYPHLCRLQVRLLCAASALVVAHALHVPARGATIATSTGKLSAASSMRQASNGPLLAPPKAEAREGAMHLRGGADANTLVFALFKAIVGSGVLCLAGGMAAFTNDVKMLPAGVRMNRSIRAMFAAPQHQADVIFTRRSSSRP